MPDSADSTPRNHRVRAPGRFRFALLVLLAITCANAADAIPIRLAPGDATISVGASQDFEIRADFGSETVVGWGLDVIFDGSVAVLSGAPAIDPLWTPLFSGDGDGLAAAAPIGGVTGDDVLLATLSFTGVAPGAILVTLAATEGDLTEGVPLLPSGFAELTLVGASLTVVPEPVPLALLGAAFLLVFASRRAKRSRGRWLAAALVVLAFAANPADAQEIEPNDEFATRTILPAGATEVSGTLHAFTESQHANHHEVGNLTPQEVTTHVFTGYAPGAPYLAFLFKFGHPSWMRSVDPSGNLVANENTSRIEDVANSDGSIRIQVTSAFDGDFTGNHAHDFPYELLISAPPYDVDFFEFSGLPVGEEFNINALCANCIRVGRFSETGALLETNIGFMTGVVPADGVLRIGFASVDDTDFDGANASTPSMRDYTYELGIEVEVPPPPPPGPIVRTSCDQSSNLFDIPAGTAVVPWGAVWDYDGEPVVVGWGRNRPFLWTPSEGVITLGSVFSTGRAYARSLVYNGAPIAVGASEDGSGRSQATRWTSTAEGLGYLPGKFHSFARAISQDGTTVVGWAGNQNTTCEAQCAGFGGTIDRSALGDQAFVWTGEFGMEPIHPPVGFDPDMSHAVAVSDDGYTVVGWIRDGHARLFRWNVDDGMEVIEPPAGFHAWATDASADAEIIVGTLMPIAGGKPLGFFWSQDEGFETFEDPRSGSDATVDLAVSSVSSDGLVAAGTAYQGGRPIEAFIVQRGGPAEILSELLAIEYEEFGIAGNWQAIVVERDFSRLLISGNLTTDPVGRVASLRCRDGEGDGLCDHWETAGGIDLDGDRKISPCTLESCPDLVLPDADPKLLDVYVEVDMLQGDDPPVAAFTQIEAAFAAVPKNVLSKTFADGIRIHFQPDERDLVLPNGRDQWSFDEDLEHFFGTRMGSVPERANPNVADAKARIFRYLLYGSALFPDNSWARGEAVVAGNHAIVSALGREGLTSESVPVEHHAALVMHEVGHTLGLRHGGEFSDNYKPNYHSIMNYNWAYTIVGRDELWAKLHNDSWYLDFSRREFNSLHEEALDETEGIGGDPNRWVLAGPRRVCGFEGGDRCPRAVPEGGFADWNENLEDDGVLSEPVDIDDLADRHDSSETIHLPHQDWKRVAGLLCQIYAGDSWLNLGEQYPTEVELGGGLPIDASDQADVFLDCNLNGVDDDQDLADGFDVDANDNGLLDGCEPLAGDVDVDGDVDPDDRDLLLAAFGRADGEPEFEYAADLDRDRVISFVDYQLWLAAHDDYQAAQASAAQTEAACGLLGVEGLLALAMLRRRRASLGRGAVG